MVNRGFPAACGCPEAFLKLKPYGFPHRHPPRPSPSRAPNIYGDPLFVPYVGMFRPTTNILILNFQAVPTSGRQLSAGGPRRIIPCR